VQFVVCVIIVSLVVPVKLSSQYVVVEHIWRLCIVDIAENTGTALMVIVTSA